MTQQTATISADVEAVPVADADTLEPGARLGRYEVIELVGRGGMALVYKARDPELDRLVAIKVLLNERGRTPEFARRERMLREAQSIAAVAHPNVVTIYDVGLYGDLIYIAMELVPDTLEAWVAAAPRAWPEILARYLEAGRGLRAAHDVGLVHRDFKPGNVLLGEDGRARVADFGLARLVAGPKSSEAQDTEETGDRSSLSVTRLTRTGSWVGTPAFMSPEQFGGDEIDARSDQFSFCIALYHDLYGQAPFEGEAFYQLQASVMRGDVRPPPSGSRVPRWIWRALAKGLMSRPEDRWRSMAALLRHLSTRRRRGWTISLVGIAALIPVAVFSVQASPDSACTGGRQALDSVWNPERRAAISAKVEAQDVAFAARSWERTEAILDDYAGQWLRTHAERCEAGGASHAAIDAQMACLEGQLEELDALLAAASREGAGAMVHSVESARRLRAPTLCADPAYASRRTHLPPDPGVRAEAEQLRDELADIAAMREDGRYRSALEVTRPLVERADALAHPPLVGRAHLELGRLQLLMSEGAEAVQHIEVAYFAGAESSDETLQNEAAVELIGAYARDLGNDEEATRWGRLALAQVDRLGDTAARADVLDAIGTAHSSRGEHREELRTAQKALSIRERLLAADDIRLAESHEAIGRAYLRLGEQDHADHHLRWALELKQMHLGPDHPSVAITLNALGVLANESGKGGQDIAYYEEALAIVERVYGPDHPRVGPLLQNLANATMREDKALANQMVQRALELREQAHGRDNPVLAGIHIALGNSYKALQRLDEAERHYRRGIDLVESTGAPAPWLAYYELSSVYWERFDCDTSVKLAEQASRLAHEDGEANVLALASQRLRAARMMWDCGEDPERVMNRVQRSRAVLVERRHEMLLARLDQWLDERGPHGARLGP